jgi:hypothetical protein
MIAAVLKALLAGAWKPIANLIAGAGLYFKGRADANRNSQLEDYENAEDIRRRVTDDRDDRVRRMEGRGFRD